jgi:hypothetical protein
VTRKIVVLSVAAAVTAMVTGGLTLASSAATGATGAAGAAGAKKHTVHYDAKTVSVFKLDKKDTVTNTNLTSRHIASAGKIKGAVVFTCHQHTAHSSAEHCKGAIALKQGVLFATAKLPFATSLLSGRITGGSGVYKGAHGTFRAVGDSGRHSILTVTYKT